VFAHQTNVNLDSRIVVFDLLDLGKQLKTVGMLVVLDAILNRVTRNRLLGKRTHIFIDEIYLFFANEYSSNFLSESWKRFRKYGALATGITQNVEDCLRSPPCPDDACKLRISLDAQPSAHRPGRACQAPEYIRYPAFLYHQRRAGPGACEGWRLACALRQRF